MILQLVINMLHILGYFRPHPVLCIQGDHLQVVVYHSLKQGQVKVIIFSQFVYSGVRSQLFMITYDGKRC